MVPLLWKIEGATPSYVFGTIHLPDPRLLDWPPSLSEAFEQADVLYTEIPLDLMTQTKAMQAMMLPGEETLQDHLPQDLYRRLAAYVEKHGQTIVFLNKWKIWAATVQLALLDHLEAMTRYDPLDLALYKKAMLAGAETDALETVQEQIAVFEGFTKQQQIDLLRDSLDQMEQADAEGLGPSEAMLLAYLSGDESELLQTMHESLGSSDPTSDEFYDRLITTRNHRMAERILAKMASRAGKVHFFAVGAGHTVGEEGVVALLRKAGLTVTRIGRSAKTPAAAAGGAKP